MHATKAIAEEYLDRQLIVWGKVGGYVPTRWGSLMIRLYNAADDVAILVDKKNLDRLHIDNPEQILERDVIAYGNYLQPYGSRRPHVRVRQAAIAFSPRVHRRLRN
ncbi:hypothetical protein [Paramicrobacterium chengjingii]|uniref:Uncharacterized protein n=1 Tax=Paramicrobacterium chengjingii TaxID=2769067 RepID=A0ABX6YI03_9MICO|nr:hypothetical protein [Microbacterium chengjingii]QPZ38403.1 hypothetical protein HCR76_16730 [Microbacterium chengjingii]